MTKIAVFVGSLQEKSYNKMLAANLERVAPKDLEFTYIDLNMPLFNQDLEANYPTDVQMMKDIVLASDGILFITPEYNRGLPGVLKNAMDWMSRPYGTSAFAHKPAGVVGAGLDHVSGAIAQSDFRHIAAYLNMKVMTQPEIHITEANKYFDENGTIEPGSEHRLDQYMAAFAAWVKNEK
jgi:chromate reductase